MKKKWNKGFVMYFNWCEMLDELPDDQALLLMRAVTKYARTKEESCFDNPTLKVIFNMIKTKINEDQNDYQEVCKKRREARLKAGQQQKLTNDNKSQQLLTNDNKSQQKSLDTNTDTNTDTDTDIDINNINIINNKKENIKEKRKRFTPPTLEEVRAYCLKRKNNIDPQQFLDHYESVGWKKSGGTPIVNWEACIRTWEGRNQNKAPPKKEVFDGDKFLQEIIDGVRDVE